MLEFQELFSVSVHIGGSTNVLPGLRDPCSWELCLHRGVITGLSAAENACLCVMVKVASFSWCGFGLVECTEQVLFIMIQYGGEEKCP